jgi:peptidoglycan/LPS O-acetylase OafA/YrhL
MTLLFVPNFVFRVAGRNFSPESVIRLDTFGAIAECQKARAGKGKMSGERLQSIQALRGLAALSVCLFHFLCANNNIAPPHFVHSAAEIGHFGITIFFVISGFVLPLSLFRGGYTLRAFPRFFAKRLIRLEPPYLVTVALATVLAFGSAPQPTIIRLQY